MCGETFNIKARFGRKLTFPSEKSELIWPKWPKIGRKWNFFFYALKVLPKTLLLVYVLTGWSQCTCIGPPNNLIFPFRGSFLGLLGPKMTQNWSKMEFFFFALKVLHERVLLVCVLTGWSQCQGEATKFSFSRHFHILASLEQADSLRNLKISPFT